MRNLLAIATMCAAVALAGCGRAEPIDPAEIDAENIRREEARGAAVVGAARGRAEGELLMLPTGRPI